MFMPKASTRPRGRVPTAELPEHEAALVEASARLFRRHGYAGVSIDMIAREAGVSPKTIYARHRGKLGLFTAVVEALVRVLRQAFVNDLASATDLAQTLEATARRLLDHVLNPDVLAIQRILIAEAPHLPELAGLFYDNGPQQATSSLPSTSTKRVRKDTSPSMIRPVPRKRSSA